MAKVTQLPFEKPIYDLDNKIEELIKLNEGSEVDLSSKIAELRGQVEEFKNNLYKNLKP